MLPRKIARNQLKYIRQLFSALRFKVNEQLEKLNAKKRRPGSDRSEKQLNPTGHMFVISRTLASGNPSPNMFKNMQINLNNLNQQQTPFT